MTTALLMFLGFIAVTLGITYWAARKQTGANSSLRPTARSRVGKTDSQSPAII